MRRDNDDTGSMVVLVLIFLGILALCAWNDSRPIQLGPKPAAQQGR